MDMPLTNGEIKQVLSYWGIHSAENVEFIDSSHGGEDIRHNYIIDRKYVLRFNSVKVMDDSRIAGLNALIRRYREFGLLAPLFYPAKDGKYTADYHRQWCYLSEYLDYPLADTAKERCRKELIAERLTLVARFAEKYRNIDLIDTVSMYSLFDLSPYDQLVGIDEKQDNFNSLAEALHQVGETALADRLTEQYEHIRSQLKAIYKELPRCVFQGDENFTNLCVDENDRIIGLFDFNMSGTEVIANYLANLAFQGNFYYTDEIMEQYGADEIFRMILESYRYSTELLRQNYSFTPQEEIAYWLYSKIVMISGYVNTAAFSEYLKQERYRHKVIQLVNLIYQFQPQSSL